ncbi:hypothetical protein D3C75_941780 [compost metagenome]
MGFKLAVKFVGNHNIGCALERAIALDAYARLQAQLGHQPLHPLVVDRLTPIGQFQCYAPVAIAPLAMVVNGADALTQFHLALIRMGQGMNLVIERAAGQLGRLEQKRQGVGLPQSLDGLRFARCAACSSWIKASSFFK